MNFSGVQAFAGYGRRKQRAAVRAVYHNNIRRQGGQEDKGMAAVTELIRTEADGSISFGNHLLEEKSKKEGFESGGNEYKVKTCHELTRLERNGMFVYESVPGTSVEHFCESDSSVSFIVEGNDDAQITLGLEAGAEYDVRINGEDAGRMGTNMGGKLNVSVELAGIGEVKVEITK